MGKSIGHSVGMGGCNEWQDVATVQYLLNCVPATEGGPLEELVIDGLIGPKTIGAIRRYQQLLNIRDGRVDPQGPTFQSIATYDPMPETSVTDGFVKGSKGNFSKDYKGKFPFAKGGKAPYIAKGGEYQEEQYDEWGKGAGKYDAKGGYGGKQQQDVKGHYPGGKFESPAQKHVPGKYPDPGKAGLPPGKMTYDYGKMQDPHGKSSFPDHGKVPGKYNPPGGKSGGGKSI